MYEVSERVFFVGVQDRISEYFDQLMPLPQGTSYNSYLIKGTEKTALIDTVDPRFTGKLLQNIEETESKRIDYVITNHAEQDHTGALPTVLERYPEAIVVCNEKCKEFLQAEHHLPEERIKVIADKETISLGGKTLQFIFAPWVHWPETMFTHLQEDNILFTCDLFGAHLATEEHWAKKELVEGPAKRYYAEIMMPFARMVAKYTKEIQALQPRIIAPSHGPLYDDPAIILDLHEKWTSENAEQRAVIAYVSMHGSTKRMAEHLLWKLKEQGIPATAYDVMQTDVGEITMNLINTAHFIIASPSYLGGLHPAAANLLFLLNGFKPHLKHIGFIGSHGWGDHGNYEQAKEHLDKIDADWFPPIFTKGHPVKEDFEKIDTLVEAIKKA